MTAANPVGAETPASWPRPPLPFAWIVALILAVALHIGVVTFIWMKAQDVDDSDALGAPAIEIGLDLAAPRDEPEDLPPGPAAEASMASVPTQEQHEKVDEVEAPKERPKEAEEPERVVAPEVPKEVKEEAPKTVETKAVQAVESVASEATAAPKVETAKEAPKSTAPSPGSGFSAELVRMAWQKKLIAHINRHKRYPATGARKSVELKVAFALDRLGHVTAASIETSSGDPAFDEAALAMLHKADPVPPPPPLLADEGLTFSMPVIFQNKRK